MVNHLRHFIHIDLNCSFSNFNGYIYIIFLYANVAFFCNICITFLCPMNGIRATLASRPAVAVATYKKNVQLLPELTCRAFCSTSTAAWRAGDGSVQVDQSIVGKPLPMR